jgi:hypothetical protein
MLDPQNELYDRRLARHLVSLYFQSRDEEDGEQMVCERVCYNPLTPELNPSVQCCLMRFFTGDFAS